MAIFQLSRAAMENLLRLALPHLSQGALDALWRSSKSLHPAIRAVLLARRAKRRDLSDGQEAIPVRVVNDVDEEPHPAVAYTKCCVCDAAMAARIADAVAAVACAAPYADGRLKASAPHPIVECGDAGCACFVVGRGVRAPLEVFKTSRRGWGLRCRRALARGEFVCEYAGELLSSAEAARRQRRAVPNYIFVVREHSRSGTWRTIIDPTHTGNVGRFANHSCDPNLAVHLVRVASLVPRIALFASRDVPALEELTISYGDSGAGGGAAPGARTPCECGAAACGGWLPCDLSA